jgi:drug/metabolite transporter (DMT)-like permease
MVALRPKGFMKLKNYLQLLLTSSLWGSSFLLMKYALIDLNPFQISSYRIFIGAIFINLISKHHKKFPAKKHFKLALVGLLWMSIPFYFFAKAEETIQSNLAGLINGATPIFISLFGVLFFAQKINKKQKTYLLIGFVGIYILSFGIESFNFNLDIGTILALLASICYGFAANIVQPLIKEFGPLNSLKMALRYASLFSLVLLIVNSDFVLPTPDNSLLPILLLGVGSSGVAFLSFYNLIDDVGAIVGSITVYIIPVFAALFGYIFLNEVTTVLQILGVVIVIFSAFRFSRS